MKRGIAAALALVCGSACADSSMAGSGSHIDAYYEHAKDKLSDDSGSASVQGSGGGAAAWIGMGPGFFTARAGFFHLNDRTDGFKVHENADEVRAGLGWRFWDKRDSSVWGRAEFVHLRATGDVSGEGFSRGNSDGPGVHIGGRIGEGMVHGYAEVGRLFLSDGDLWEYLAGAEIQPFAPLAFFAEYRHASGDLKEIDVHEKVDSIRAGVRVPF